MVHQYKNNGYNIVMDINSGAIHVVDDVVYDTLLLMEQMLPEEEVLARYNTKCSEGATDISTSYTEAEIKEAYEEIKELYDTWLGKPLGEKAHSLLHTHYHQQTR